MSAELLESLPTASDLARHRRRHQIRRALRRLRKAINTQLLPLD